MNEELSDRELKKLIKRKNQEKWLDLFMMLCEIEKRFRTKIKWFQYTPNELIIETDIDLIRVNLI